MKEFFDQYKWILTIIGTLFIGASTLGIRYVDWQISAKVADAVKGDSTVVAASQVSPERITALEATVAAGAQRHISDSERMDSKIERIVDILLEE